MSGLSMVSPLKGIGMLSAENAEQLGAVNPVIRLRNGEIINPMGYQKFHLEEMNNLARMYRFGAKVDFTVLDHIRLGLFYCDSDIEKMRYWVLHEAWESLTLDVPKPLKATWPWYVEGEHKYLEFVYGYHGLDYSKYEEMVSELDRHCFTVEWEYFFEKKFHPKVEFVREETFNSFTDYIQRLFPEIYGQ